MPSGNTEHASLFFYVQLYIWTGANHVLLRLRYFRTLDSIA
jgi:hypothetical protein